MSWFECRLEERTEMVETSIERLIGERISTEETFNEWEVGEVTQKGTVSSEQQLLRIESAKTSGSHL
jgi:hypothetical protein